MSFLRKATQLLATQAAMPVRRQERNLVQLLASIEELYHIRDLDVLLERVLLEARRFVRADAGTIYLLSQGYLYFSYVQNDTLFRDERPESRYLYSSTRLPVDTRSLAGYVAHTGEPLMIDDVYHIHSDVTYSFNPSYDRKSSYRTRSMLIVPLETHDDTLVGVLQLINCLDESRNVIPFSVQDKMYVSHFGLNAANALEKARLSQEMVLRMVEMAGLRDPHETSQHSKRVGAYSAEIYRAYAQRHGLDARETRKTLDLLRTAAMLHDIGKIAVSDLILTKPATLEPQERQAMRAHTIHGARILRYGSSPWVRMAAEVALNHHERWDGRGYPGKVDVEPGAGLRFGPGKKGEEIPLAARIVSIADVYDALLSGRSYKHAWNDEEALDYVRNEAGKQFDPELVEVFLSIGPVVAAIRKKYSY